MDRFISGLVSPQIKEKLHIPPQPTSFREAVSSAMAYTAAIFPEQQTLRQRSLVWKMATSSSHPLLTRSIHSSQRGAIQMLDASNEESEESEESEKSKELKESEESEESEESKEFKESEESKGSKEFKESEGSEDNIDGTLIDLHVLVLQPISPEDTYVIMEKDELLSLNLCHMGQSSSMLFTTSQFRRHTKLNQRFRL